MKIVSTLFLIFIVSLGVLLGGCEKQYEFKEGDSVNVPVLNIKNATIENALIEKNDTGYISRKRVTIVFQSQNPPEKAEKVIENVYRYTVHMSLLEKNDK